MIKVGMVSLGCPKNQVDAEMLLFSLEQDGFFVTPIAEEADVVVVNTCGFIDDAKRESIDSILQYGAMRTAGRLKCLVVTGCLAERYREEVAAELPEVDVIAGIGANASLPELIRSALSGRREVTFPDKLSLPMEGGRKQSTPSHMAYLKIAEGCSNHCTYCAIPMIRGPYRSRGREEIVKEAEALAKNGVKELILIAQDTSRYGEDLYEEYRLADLLQDLDQIEGLRWIRFLYCYPERITDRLIQAVKNARRVLPYFDIPIQHIDDLVLRRMNRGTTGDEIREVIRKLRAEIPGVVLRTTLIAGFPGESEAQFAKLLDFVGEAQFQRLGCFSYSVEEGTPAERLPDQLDEDEKRRRADLVMERQMFVAGRWSESLLGTTVEAVVEGVSDETGRTLARSWRDAPEIDGVVWLESEKPLSAGEFVTVRITEVDTYDLIGTVLESEGR